MDVNRPFQASWVSQPMGCFLEQEMHFTSLQTFYWIDRWRRGAIVFAEIGESFEEFSKYDWLKSLCARLRPFGGSIIYFLYFSVTVLYYCVCVYAMFLLWLLRRNKWIINKIPPSPVVARCHCASVWNFILRRQSVSGISRRWRISKCDFSKIFERYFCVFDTPSIVM